MSRYKAQTKNLFIEWKSGNTDNKFACLSVVLIGYNFCSRKKITANRVEPQTPSSAHITVVQWRLQDLVRGEHETKRVIFTG